MGSTIPLTLYRGQDAAQDVQLLAIRAATVEQATQSSHHMARMIRTQEFDIAQGLFKVGIEPLQLALLRIITREDRLCR